MSPAVFPSHPHLVASRAFVALLTRSLVALGATHRRLADGRVAITAPGVAIVDAGEDAEVPESQRPTWTGVCS